jgi:hypothetical protein
MDKGRHEDEYSVVAVLDGVYKGYAWLDKSLNLSPPEILDLLEEQRDNREVRQIIKTFVRKNSLRKIPLQ